MSMGTGTGETDTGRISITQCSLSRLPLTTSQSLAILDWNGMEWTLHRHVTGSSIRTRADGRVREDMVLYVVYLV